MAREEGLYRVPQTFSRCMPIYVNGQLQAVGFYADKEEQAMADQPLAERALLGGLMPTPADAGRRLRVAARLLRASLRQTLEGGQKNWLITAAYPVQMHVTLPLASEASLTLGLALAAVQADPTAYDALRGLPLRGGLGKDAGQTRVTALSQIQNIGRDPELPEFLQDLAEVINRDIAAACAAFDTPDLYYPGVDEGIAPVSDDHVQLVIAALTRELTRERRPKLSEMGRTDVNKLPHAPLGELPFRVQRALVERRRLRFAQYGIGREQWLSGTWSFWDVPEDPDWLPH